MQRSTFSAENFLLPQLFTPCPSEVRSATLSVERMERMEHVERIEHAEHCGACGEFKIEKGWNLAPPSALT